jgi:hypothetical protein
MDKQIYPDTVTQILANDQEVTDKVYNVYDFPFETVCTKLLRYRYCGGHQTAYIGDFGTFDIETTTYQMSIIDNEPQYNAFMYHWQFCIDDKVIIGRTWGEFLSLLEGLKAYLGLSQNKKFVIYVHNLSFEFQFFRNFVSLSNVFSLERRKVVKCIVNEVFEFRCSWKLSNMSLQKFVSNTPGALYWKKKGDLDYKIERTPKTPLTNEELAYCYNDVRGLREAIKYLLKSEHDTLATIPLTSTGYVRREFRSAINKNKANHYLFKDLRLTPFQYALLKTATRGGNCHCNPVLSGAVDDRNVFNDVGSYDMSSAYPAVMTQCKFPMSPFLKREDDKSIIDKCIEDGSHALLIDCVFYDLKIKTLNTVPYIPKAKCTKLWEPRIDNGRVLSADFCGMVMTDIDWKIIVSQYSFTHVDILNLYSAKYDYLPIELRQKVIEQYTDKCKLKWGDPYLYMKYKNKINADFGMMLTDICRREISYDENSKENPFSLEPWNIEASMARYYNSRNSFLAYQWGVWVTAHCRRRLQKAIDRIGIDSFYCDTDSLKYLGEHDEDFEALNEEILSEAEKCQLLTSCDVTDPEGKLHHFQLGIWEKEKTYETFKSLGAKKYAYTYEFDKDGNPDPNLHITVAGLSKEKGGKWLTEHGGMEKFNTRTIIPAGASGRSVSSYIDHSNPYILYFKGEKILTGSAIAIYETSYTFSITSEYQELLADLEGVGI